MLVPLWKRGECQSLGCVHLSAPWRLLSMSTLSRNPGALLRSHWAAEHAHCLPDKWAWLEATRGPSVRISVVTMAGITARKISLLGNSKGYMPLLHLTGHAAYYLSVEVQIGRFGVLHVSVNRWTEPLQCWVLSCVHFPCDPIACSPAGLICPWDFPRHMNTGNTDCHLLLQIFQPRDKTRVSCVFAIGRRVPLPLHHLGKRACTARTHMYRALTSVYVAFPV